MFGGLQNELKYRVLPNERGAMMLEQKDLEMIAEVVQRETQKAIAPINEKIDSMDERLDSMDGRIGAIETMIENDISHNIKIIAEGHADLSRKLSDVIETERERELLKVRVNLLEADVKMLKAKVNV